MSRTTLVLFAMALPACKEGPEAPKLAQFGELCRTDAPDDSEEHCDEDLFCLRSPELLVYGDGQGYCAELCYEDRDCTREDGNTVKCDPVDMVCKFTCQSDEIYCRATFPDTILKCEQESGICYDDGV